METEMRFKLKSNVNKSIDKTCYMGFIIMAMHWK